MAGLTSTNTQYYLLVGLLKDVSDFSLDHSLERDMHALVYEGEDDTWSTKGDISNLARLVIRCCEKAGISVTESLGDESDYNADVDRDQVIKDLFSLHDEVKEFLAVTWGTERSQQEHVNDLVAKVLIAAAHSSTVLRSEHHKKALVAGSAF